MTAARGAKAPRPATPLPAVTWSSEVPVARQGLPHRALPRPPRRGLFLSGSRDRATGATASIGLYVRFVVDRGQMLRRSALSSAGNSRYVLTNGYSGRVDSGTVNAFPLSVIPSKSIASSLGAGSTAEDPPRHVKTLPPDPP